MRNQFHPDAVAAQGTAGSVLLFDCRLMHTKAPNDTDSERLAVQVRYGAGWCTAPFPPPSLATCEDLWADECAVRSDYTRLNHSGEANRGPPLQEEIMQQLPEAVRPRFVEYE